MSEPGVPDAIYDLHVRANHRPLACEDFTHVPGPIGGRGDPVASDERGRSVGMLDLNGLCKSIHTADRRQLEAALALPLIYLTESEHNRRQTLCLDEPEEAAAGFECASIEANTR